MKVCGPRGWGQILLQLMIPPVAKSHLWRDFLAFLLEVWGGLQVLLNTAMIYLNKNCHIIA